MAKAKTKPGQGRAAGQGKAKAPPASDAFFRPFASLPKERAAQEKKEQAERAAAAKLDEKAERARAEEAARRSRESAARARGRVEGTGATAAAGGTDADTFAIYMSGVSTLEGKSNRIPRTASEVDKRPVQVPREDADAPARASMGALVAEGIRFELSDDGERIEGRRLDVDPRELRRLRRSEYAIDGKLDLHGLGADEARRAVEAFVQKRRSDGDRVVLVVHGKGRHSPRGAGVLRGEIGAWLSQGRAARDVAAFASAGEIRVPRGGNRADPADDVPGAVLVLLAR